MSQYNVQFQDGNGSLAGLRNLLINGNAVVAQRTTASGTVSGNSRVYGIYDRWVIGVQAGGAWGTASSTRDNRNAMLFNATGVTNFSVGQVVEYLSAWQLGGQTVTLSGWVKAASAFTATTGLQWYDTATDANIAGAGSAVTETLPVTTSWTYFSQTFTVPTTPPIASYANSWGMNIGFSNLPVSASFEIQDIQLEPGPIATPFEQRPVGLELELCQRYYYKSTLAFQSSSGGTTNGAQLWFPVTMRATPTATVSAGSAFTSAGYSINGATFQTTGAGAAVIAAGYQFDAEL